MNNNWKTITRKGRYNGGGNWECTEREKELSSDNGRRTIEAVVLRDVHVDSGGNESIDAHKGYHYVALLEGKNQLSFAFQYRNGWRVLSDDCITFVKDVKTKKEAISFLADAAKEAND